MYKEPISAILNKAGDLLFFDSFEIYAVPSIDFKMLAGEPSTYEVFFPEIVFRTSSCTIAERSIVEGMSFSIVDDVYRYTFKINRNPLPDFTGWAAIPADFVTKAVL